MKRITNLFLIPKPFNFYTVRRRALLICYLIINIRLIMSFYKKIPINNYTNKLKENPENLYKCLGRYLSRHLSIKKRAEILKHHHIFMCKKFTNIFLTALNEGGDGLWQKTTEEGQHFISVSTTQGKITFLEGEVALEYRFNDALVYKLAFTFIPNSILDKSIGDSFFIGCSQRAKRNKEQWELAKKSNFRLSPEDILLIALQALAYKTNTPNIIGISAKHNVSKTVHSDYSRYALIYDQLWINNGAIQHQDNFVMGNIPYMKDRSEKNNYRSRDKKQDALRLEIFEEIKNNLTQFLV